MDKNNDSILDAFILLIRGIFFIFLLPLSSQRVVLAMEEIAMIDEEVERIRALKNSEDTIPDPTPPTARKTEAKGFVVDTTELHDPYAAEREHGVVTGGVHYTEDIAYDPGDFDSLLEAPPR